MHGGEHDEAHAAPGLRRLHHAVVAEGGERDKDVGLTVERADCFGGLQREALGEDGELRQQCLLGRAQQVIAPIERGAQRLVAAFGLAHAVLQE